MHVGTDNKVVVDWYTNLLVIARMLMHKGDDYAAQIEDSGMAIEVARIGVAVKFVEYERTNMAVGFERTGMAIDFAASNAMR